VNGPPPVTLTARCPLCETRFEVATTLVGTDLIVRALESSVTWHVSIEHVHESGPNVREYDEADA
jgi:hypothetical protein